MANQIKHFYEFGSVTLDVTSRLLYKDGAQLSLQPRVIDTLVVLIKNARTVVDKDTLLTEVWPDIVVEEGGLKRNISILRKALGEHGQCIETLPKRGYRFNAEVREKWIESAAIPAQPQSVDVALRRRAKLRITHEEEIEDSSDGTPARYQWTTAKQLIGTRRARLVSAASITVLLATGVLFWAATNKLDSTGAAPIRSIAVLPFKNLAPRTGDEHFGVGIADALITRLSAIKSLSVRPTSAVLKFNSPEQDSISAGKALDVEAVLEGSIYKVNDRMRITARLVRVNNQMPIWAGQFDEKDDLLAIQNSIPQHIVSLLELNISGSERDALAKRHTENRDAYDLYLEGRFHWNKRTPEGMRQAEGLFRRAMATDPNFALAYLGLADILSMGDGPAEADIAIDKAIRLDDSLGEAYASRGFTRAMNRWQWSEAEADFKRSIELSPGYGTAHQWYATLLAITGRVEDAKAQMRAALAIDPTSPNFLADLGQMHYFAREYDQAESYCKKALEIQPEFVFALAYLKEIYFKKGEYDKAFDAYLGIHRAMLQSAAYSNTREIVDQQIAQLKEIYSESGYPGLLRNEVRQTPQSSPDNGYKYALFVTHAQLNEKEKALEWLEKSYESHNFMLPFAHPNPMFDNLRSEPRFGAVFRRMGLSL
jgi:DNA-binding winged helix-turn-helix (wHTH) protein/TolB-like protein/tetratricopeptide (TPR) repeat protein